MKDKRVETLNDELNVPKKIKIVKAYHSVGYQPVFHKCPNCNHDLTWQEKEDLKCRCNQLLMN